MKFFLFTTLILIHSCLFAQTTSSSTEKDTSVPRLRELNVINVTGKKAALQVRQDRTVLDLSKSAGATGVDVLTAIGQMPGVRITNTGIAIAGRGSLKVMVNGRLIQLSGTDLLRFLKSMSANQVSKIEVIKVPPASLDAEGNAGLINIVTRRSKQKGFSGNAQASGKHWIHHKAEIYGTKNYYAANASADLNYNAEKWSAYANLNTDRDHHLEGFETDLFYPAQRWLQTDTGNYTYRNFNGMAGIDYKLRNATVGLSYAGGRSVYDGSDNVNNPVYNKAGSLDSTLHTYATYHPVALSNALGIHADVRLDTSGKKLSFNADYFNYYRTDQSNFESHSFLPNNPSTAAGTTRYYDNNKQHIIVYTIKTDLVIPTAFAQWSFGGKLSFIDNYSNAFYYDKDAQGHLTYNNILSNEFDYKENTQALYAGIDKAKDRWKLNAGLRAEYTETKGYSYTLGQTTRKEYLKLFPSVLLSFQRNKDNNFSFSFGRRINRPTFWNLNPFKSLFTSTSYGEGNPYLQPEYNTNLDLSHTFRNALTSSLFFSITDNGFNNATIANTDTSLVYTIPLNFIKTYRYGISESFSLRRFRWLENNVLVSAYHTDAYSSIPQFQDIHGYGLYISMNNTFYLDREKNFAGVLNGWYQFPEVDHIGRSLPYYKVDFGLSASILKKAMTINLLLNDVFRSSALAFTSAVNGIPQQFTNFQINRWVQLTMSYKFGGKGTTERSSSNMDERNRI